MYNFILIIIFFPQNFEGLAPLFTNFCCCFGEVPFWCTLMIFNVACYFLFWELLILSLILWCFGKTCLSGKTRSFALCCFWGFVIWRFVLFKPGEFSWNIYVIIIFPLFSLFYWTELLLSSTGSPDPLTFFFSIFCIYLWVFLLSGLSIRSDAFRPSIEFLPYVFIFQELFILPNPFLNDPFLNAVSSLKSLRILWF